MILERDGIYVAGKSLRITRIKNEFLKDVENPVLAIRELKGRSRTDLFTFWQRYPDTAPRFPYHLDWDNWAVLPVTSYENWFQHQINSKVRAKVRRAAKMGVEIKIVPLSDVYIAGVTKIFNETPARQGKKFPRYGASFEEVATALRTEAARNNFIGAYYQGEMIVFTQQVNFQDGAYPFGGTSLVSHRDKPLNNAAGQSRRGLCEQRRPFSGLRE